MGTADFGINFLEKKVRDFLFFATITWCPRKNGHPRLCVGLSGGVDSVVLLHLLNRLRHDIGFDLSAVHVHHGLSPNADRWAEFCSDLCRNLMIPIEVARVKVHNQKKGIEAAARAARYAVFEKLDTDAIVLAHHQDDQAETMLLQLLRGAGVKGLSAMPQMRFIGKKHLLRPLLDVNRSDIQRYACTYNLNWIEDESNMATKFARNYLRHKVLPVIEQRFPAYRKTLTRSAKHFADCAKLLDILAQEDLGRVRIEDGLDAKLLTNMDRTRVRNLLRYYLTCHGCPAPSTEWLDEAIGQLLGSNTFVRIGYNRWGLERHRNVIKIKQNLR